MSTLPDPTPLAAPAPQDATAPPAADTAAQQHAATADTPAPVAASADPAFDGWRGLPPRGAAIAAAGSVLAMALPLAIAAGVASVLLDVGNPALATLAGAVLGGLPGAWLGASRHRRTRWRIDGHGFALRRGRLWQTDSHVPISRVQHLDVKRGPLERALSLATLVIHTAGTRMAAVSVAMLDEADAEHLRDLLARQLDQDDDAL